MIWTIGVSTEAVATRKATRKIRIEILPVFLIMRSIASTPVRVPNITKRPFHRAKSHCILSWMAN